jgi:gas vesicle protein
MGEKESGNSFIIGFILGAIAGVAVGFLYAPKAGKETRTLLKEKAGELKEKATEMLSRGGKESGKG